MYSQNEIEISIIKTVCIILFTYYTNFRILNQKIEFKMKMLCKSILSIIVSIICVVLRYKINYLVSMVCLSLIVSIVFSPNKILTTIISLGINYIISLVSVIINFAFNVVIKLNNNYVNLIFILLCHAIILNAFFSIKKFKYGITFLKEDVKNEYIDIFILNMSVVILLATIILVNSEIALAIDMTAGVIVSAIIMFIAIKKSIQIYYKQKLLIQDLNETKEELEKTKSELKQVEDENLGLSKKSHSIAHKQKALEYKMEQLLTNVEISKEEAGEVQDRIKEIQKDLYKDKATIELIKTEIPKIDDMLEYMQSECIKNKIEFELQISGNIHYMVNNLIAKEDLEILLADHIKDAIIAINHTDNINRSILVRLGEIDGIYSLYIYDSGIEFEKETLSKLGKSPITTHASEGGTGMGFMNTFDTLKKYQASLTINELSEPNKDNYTKVLIFRFDKKNEFNIISYRQ